MGTTTVEKPAEADSETAAEDALCDVAGVLNSQHARLVRLTADALDNDDWQGAGIMSPSHWLTIQMGLSPARAKQIVTIAEHTTEFPILMKTFDAGQLAVDQVFEIASKAPGWADRNVTEFAKAATVSQLRRVIRDEYFDDDTNDTDQAVDNESDSDSDAGSSNSRNRCWFGFDDHSRFRFNADLAADQGIIIDAAINEARDALFRAGHTNVTWADAFTQVATRSLAAAPSERRERFKTYIHYNTDTRNAATTAGVRLPDSIRDYLLCNSLTQPVWERDNIPFGVGRTQRIVPDRTRRIIEHRDQGCVIPDCDATHVEIHHIVHWTTGNGPTETWNLASTCPKHHRLVHQHKLHIAGNADTPDGLTFTDNNNKPWGQTTKPTPPNRQPPQPTARYEHPSGGQLQAQWLHWSKTAIQNSNRRQHRQQQHRDNDPPHQ